ncbi:MAG TPA: serine/threonine-protein kinase [Polyangiaceae bacterium]|nr:serine/threonine-protein kinase [Polyangiaceae bacterium]
MTAATTSSWKSRRVGERLGRYVLGPSIGAGGAASVYLARLDGPHGFERLLAIKIVHEHLLEDKDFIAMFLDEANLTVRLSHPNIVHTYELGRQGDVLFLAMEYLRGKPLSLVYQRAFEQGAPLEYDLVAWLGARCADALHYAHALKDEQGQSLKIVHRDISPDNLFITYEGEIKVIDFGIARAEGRLARTDLGSVKGKFRYMSPEYALGRIFDHTLDLFALGASLYEVALGQAAFAGADSLRTVERLVLGDVIDPVTLRPDFPPELARILTRAMSTARTLRYESGSELARDLDGEAKLTLTEARARLAQRMHALFGPEIANESAVVTEVRRLRPATLNEDTPPVHHELSARTAEPAARSRWLWPVLGLGGGAAIAASLLLSRTPAPSRAGEPAPAPAAAAAAASTVTETAGSRTEPNAPPKEIAAAAPSASVSSQLAPAPAAPAARSGNAGRRGKLAEGGPAPALATSGTSAKRPPATGSPPGESTGVIRANPFATGP